MLSLMSWCLQRALVQLALWILLLVCLELLIWVFRMIQGHPPAMLQVLLVSHAALGQHLVSALIWEPFLQYK